MVLGYDLPEAIAPRVGRDALEHQCARSYRKRAVDDIGVSCDPSHVSRAPVGFSLPVVKHVLHRHRCLQEITARGVKHAFWFSGRARRVEDE